MMTMFVTKECTVRRQQGGHGTGGRPSLRRGAARRVALWANLSFLKIEQRVHCAVQVCMQKLAAWHDLGTR